MDCHVLTSFVLAMTMSPLCHSECSEESIYHSKNKVFGLCPQNDREYLCRSKDSDRKVLHIYRHCEKIVRFSWQSINNAFSKILFIQPCGEFFKPLFEIFNLATIAYSQVLRNFHCVPRKNKHSRIFKQI